MKKLTFVCYFVLSHHMCLLAKQTRVDQELFQLMEVIRPQPKVQQHDARLFWTEHCSRKWIQPPGKDTAGYWCGDGKK